MKLPKTTREQVYQAVVDLSAAGELGTRVAVQEMTRLKQSIVDEQLKTLANDLILTRPEKTRGVYRLAKPVQAERPFSVTVLPTGRVKLEVEDEMMELSFRESALMGLTLQGYAPRMFDRPGAEQGVEAEFRKEIQRLTATVTDLKRTLNQSLRQRSLEFEDVPCKPQSSNVKQGRA